ncbi:hypothetical protein [Corynebacterium falsenii]
MNASAPVTQPPTTVRAVGSLFFGLAVGIMIAPLAPGFQAIVLIASVGIALLMTFSHPYRKQVRAEVEKRGERYRTSAAQVMPLFPLWLALMVLPLMSTRSWVLMVIIWVVASAYAWFVYPQIDGTAHIKPQRTSTGNTKH